MSTVVDDISGTTKSKNQLKRELRSQKRLATKREWRKEKRDKEKDRKKKKMEDLLSQGLSITKPPKIPLDQCEKAGHIIIDLSYDSLMTEKEVNSLMSQVSRCYADNRRSKHPLNLYVNNLSGPSKLRMESAFGGYTNWDVHFQEDMLTSPENKDKIVYLTADSENTLQELDDNVYYVIGGIVDRNRHKGIALKRSQELGVSTAKLPIGEYVNLASSRVLTVNHVCEIMLKYKEFRDWKTAFDAVIPARKIIQETNK